MVKWKSGLTNFFRFAEIDHPMPMIEDQPVQTMDRFMAKLLGLKQPDIDYSVAPGERLSKKEKYDLFD